MHPLDPVAELELLVQDLRSVADLIEEAAPSVYGLPSAAAAWMQQARAGMESIIATIDLAVPRLDDAA